MRAVADRAALGGGVVGPAAVGRDREIHATSPCTPGRWRWAGAALVVHVVGPVGWVQCDREVRAATPCNVRRRAGGAAWSGQPAGQVRQRGTGDRGWRGGAVRAATPFNMGRRWRAILLGPASRGITDYWIRGKSLTRVATAPQPLPMGEAKQGMGGMARFQQALLAT